MSKVETFGGRILDLLSKAPGLSDREITDRLLGTGKPPQRVNAECRLLQMQGLLRREKQLGGPILNYLSGERRVPDHAVPKSLPAGSQLDEDAVKSHLEAWLKLQGWIQVSVAWGHDHGADIEATRGTERWVIEVKGSGSLQPMRVNYFLAILGELLQRMDDPDALYSIALPDLEQYHGLWGRLPALAKERTSITALFVDSSGRVEQVR